MFVTIEIERLLGKQTAMSMKRGKNANKMKESVSGWWWWFATSCWPLAQGWRAFENSEECCDGMGKTDMQNGKRGLWRCPWLPHAASRNPRGNSRQADMLPVAGVALLGALS